MKYDYFPSWSQLHGSLKRRIKEYFVENSLHGIPYFSDRTRPTWERIIWFILTMASLGATIAIIIIIWDKFQTNPTLTGLDTFTDDLKIDFPQVFLCFDQSQLNFSNLKRFPTPTEKEVYEALYTWQWGEKISDGSRSTNSKSTFSYYDLFEISIPKCGLVFTTCSFRGIDLSCAKNLTRVITPVGACCKFNASESLSLNDAPWEFAFASQLYPLRLYILNKLDVAPLRDQRPHQIMFFPFTMYMELQITYATPNLRFLSLHQRQCRYDDEQSTYNNCRLKCLTHQIFKRCKCLPWFLYDNNVNECRLSDYSCIRAEYKSEDHCDCSLSCNQTVYRYTDIERINTNDGKNVPSKIAIQPWPEAIYRREVRFGLLDLVVSFGGIAGLFLGYSLLTTIEFFYYLTVRMYCGAVLDSSRRKHNIIKVHTIEARASARLNDDVVYYGYLD